MAIYSAPVMAILDALHQLRLTIDTIYVVVPGGTSRDGEVVTSPVQDPNPHHCFGV
jgi:hypothetical protein